MEFFLGMLLGAAIVGIAWWVNYRKLNNVISDLKDAKEFGSGVVKKFRD